MSVELREKENASISYTIKAELYPNDGWHDHKDSWIPLSVISPIDTSFAKYRQSVTASGRTSVGCCATPFRTTSLDICTDKQGFHAGESISFTGVLINRSKDLLKSSITLCQELLFNRHESEAGEPFSMFKVLKTVQTDDLLPCSRLVWEENGIAIPPRTPLSILNCHLFQLRYFAEVTGNMLFQIFFTRKTKTITISSKFCAPKVTLRNSDDQKILSVELPFTVGTAPPPPTRVSLRGAHLLRVKRTLETVT
ncbi:hypothetical protein RvY_15319-1 [Ramazzottius varieornatus]|uniref:Arrestin C-terminal-like domain-containing protein n=1 Tax=Ramazzottius varieornatus TaxID=947166 RepID=A0A1D1W1C3_RAMVA|nr:hypothetical protein RvY_15319-1 [Ramazzottius varieornatus]